MQFFFLLSCIVFGTNRRTDASSPVANIINFPTTYRATEMAVDIIHTILHCPEWHCNYDIVIFVILATGDPGG